MERLRTQRGAMSLITVVLVMAVVGAIVAVPFVFMGRAETDDARTALKAVDQANDAGAEVLLTNAVRGAQVWLAENGTLEGYGPQEAVAFDPQATYDTSPVAQANHVSIRGVGPQTVVLVTMGGGGPLCVSMTGQVVGYGRTDASAASQCSGTAW